MRAVGRVAPSPKRKGDVGATGHFGAVCPFAAPDASAPSAAVTDLPSFCRVVLTLTPSSDSDIKSEVWLPLAGWNGKFQQVGNGGWGGSIQYAALATALRRGYAASSTDTGHVGDTAQFALGHPEKLIDFGYRAVHETAVQSKATIAAAYGTAPRLSYFVGCSGGGRQAFMEAQRYPQDFDGIVAGAPGYNRTDQSFQLVSASQATHRDAASFIPPAKLAVLHQAALEACDGRDGLRDGLISDPLRCTVRPGCHRLQGRRRSRMPHASRRSGCNEDLRAGHRTRTPAKKCSRASSRAASRAGP